MNIFSAKTCTSPADLIWRLAKSYRLDSRKQGQTLNTNLAVTYADLVWHSGTHVHVAYRKHISFHDSYVTYILEGKNTPTVLQEIGTYAEHVMAKSDESAYPGLAERVKVTTGG